MTGIFLLESGPGFQVKCRATKQITVGKIISVLIDLHQRGVWLADLHMIMDTER